MVYSQILSKRYTYDSYNSISFIDISAMDVGNRLFQVLSGTLDSFFGYSNGCRFFSLEGIGNICTFICIFIMLISFLFAYKKYPHKDSPYNMYFKFTVCNILINYFVYIFTDGAFSAGTFIARYCGPVLIHGLLYVFICLKDISQKICQRGLYIILTGSFVLLSVIHFNKICDSNFNECRENSLRYIQEQDMRFGYATYWNANISTELTDGSVKIAPVYNFQTMHFFDYLTLKDYESQQYSEEKCFILMTVQEYEESAMSPVILGGNKEYEDDFFIIYTYPGSEKIYELVEQ